MPTVPSPSYSRWCQRDTLSVCHTSHPLPTKMLSVLTPLSPSWGGPGTLLGCHRSLSPGYRLSRGGSSGRGRRNTQPNGKTEIQHFHRAPCGPTLVVFITVCHQNPCRPWQWLKLRPAQLLVMTKGCQSSLSSSYRNVNTANQTSGSHRLSCHVN